MPQAPTKAPAPAAKKPANGKKAPAKAAPAATTEERSSTSDRPIIYKTVESQICQGADAITAQVAKDILGWETEKEYAERKVKENPGTKLEAWTYGDAFMLKDEHGNKVNCWNNMDNRPFDEQWSRGLAQTILRRQWAGPTTIPGETVNGSTIVISRTGKVESGQHSLVAVILAHQMWEKNRKAHDQWAEPGPVIETIVITGISEDSRVLMTVDNCKPRSESDVFYTSELFRNLLPVDRKECSRMLATAVDVLWRRTHTQGYKTHSEVVGFVDRHKKLLKGVEHLFVENSSKSEPSRKIAKLRISAGMGAALCYLMGASGPKTDGDVYRNRMPPSEKDIDWERWDKAKEFWALLGSSPQFKIVRTALARLVDSSNEGDNIGLGGREPEKVAILAKAWDTFLNYDAELGVDMFSEDDLLEGGALALSYNDLDDKGNKLPDGQVKLLDIADFEGIDCPDRKLNEPPPPPPPSPEELEAKKQEEKRRRAEEEQAKINQLRADKGKPAAPVVLQQPTNKRPGATASGKK